MSFLADLHIHSRYSRATSRECHLEGLHAWAQRKGVRVVGCGDFTHPEWFAELREKLVPAADAPGLYRLRADLAAAADADVPASCRAPVYFILSGEISSIYKRADRTRKVHSLVLAPDLDTVARVNARLDAIGNIKSDGRPILGLDPRNLLEIILEADEAACLIPAHIWTPWFSMLGSKSGFDSAEECFGDLVEHIFAVETGLSSDPPMNWRVSSLDRFSLVSNSDLHSPRNLGRNANIFHCEPGYHAMMAALRAKDPQRFGGTIDMFPEEGKYHGDGHRKCGVCFEPEESLSHDCLCPVCGKPLVLGVLHRVVALADRPRGLRPGNALPHEYIISLPELLAGIYDCGAGTKKVATAYGKLLRTLGPELRILRECPLEEIAGCEPRLLAEAVRRVRQGEVIRRPGYDGEYGVIRVFEPDEKSRLLKQGFLLQAPAARPAPRARASRSRTPAGGPGAAAESDDPAYRLEPSGSPAVGPGSSAGASAPGKERSAGPPARFEIAGVLAGLNPEQQAAASITDRPVLIVAGPGTGKTRTLTRRIAYLLEARGAAAESILAVTFTNRAAREMRERLTARLGDRAARLRVTTFHGFCLGLLRDAPAAAGLPEEFTVIDGDREEAVLREQGGYTAREAAAALAAIAAARSRAEAWAELPGGDILSAALRQKAWLPLGDIVPRCLEMLRAHPDHLERLGLEWLCVDEFQDINPAQYALVRRLAGRGRGVCVIGDPDQSIYGFRGSDPACFEHFVRDFAPVAVCKLARNYRSTGRLALAAARVMAAGRGALSVAAASALDAGLHLRLYEAPTAAAEAEFITHEIEKWLGGTAHFSRDSARVADGEEGGELGFGDIAVLVRLRALIPPYAAALERLGLPVQVVGGREGDERKKQEQLLEKLLALPPARLGDPAARVLAELTAADVAAGAAWPGWLIRAGGGPPAPPESAREWLDRVFLRTAADAYEERAERVTIMTMHAAKGLEFPLVFVPACEDGILPLRLEGRDTDEAEERRLFYVAMTRAGRALYLTHARRRTLFGKSGERRPSPFLRAIEAELAEVLARPASRRKKPRFTQLEFGFS